MTFETRVLTITVAQPIGVVSAYLADPRNYPHWASGLAGGLSSLAGKSSEDADPQLWSTRTPHGEVTIRFTAANEFGVADHWVYLRTARRSTFRFAPSPTTAVPRCASRSFACPR